MYNINTSNNNGSLLLHACSRFHAHQTHIPWYILWFYIIIHAQQQSSEHVRAYLHRYCQYRLNASSAPIYQVSMIILCYVHLLIAKMHVGHKKCWSPRKIRKITKKYRVFSKKGIHGHFFAKKRYILKPSVNHTPAALRLASLTHIVPVFALKWPVNTWFCLLCLAFNCFEKANFEPIRGHTLLVSRHVSNDVS